MGGGPKLVGPSQAVMLRKLSNKGLLIGWLPGTVRVY